MNITSISGIVHVHNITDIKLKHIEKFNSRVSNGVFYTRNIIFCKDDGTKEKIILFSDKEDVLQKLKC